MSAENQDFKDKVKSLNKKTADMILKLPTKYQAITTIAHHNRVNTQQNKIIRLCSRDYADIITEYCDVLYYKPAEDYVILDEETGIYTNNHDFLINAINCMQLGTKETLSKTVVSEVGMTLLSNSQLFTNEKIVQFAPNHIVKFKNCVVDLKTKKILKDNEAKQYKFVKRCDYNFKRLEECNSNYISMVEEMFENWSDNNDDKIKLILQVVFATIEGFGRYKYVILRGGGGNGKSTFLEILKRVASADQCVELNMQDISKDNVLCQITSDTKLLVGDEIATNLRMTNDDIARFKMLSASSAAIQVSQKYKDNAKIRTNAVMIQSANTDVRFFETTAAIEDRLLILDWTSTNYRQKKVDSPLARILKRLLLHSPETEFIETVIAYAISRVDYFEYFDTTAETELAAQELVYEADTTAQFVGYLKDIGLLDYSVMPLFQIYSLYKDWLEVENPGSKPMSSHSFSKKIKSYLGKLGYKIPQQDVSRLSSIPLYNFNYHRVSITSRGKNYENSLENLGKTQRILFNPDNSFTDDDVDLCKQLFKEREESLWVKVKKINNYKLLVQGLLCEMLTKGNIQSIPIDIVNEVDNIKVNSPDYSVELIEKFLF